MAGILLYFPWSSIYWPIFQGAKRITGYAAFDRCPTWVSCVCAGSGAIGATALTYPLDLMRTRLAIQTKGQWYSSMFSGYSQIVDQEGLRGLYRGLNATLLGVVPYMCIQMALHDRLRPTLVQREWSSPAMSSFWSGLVSGTIAKTLIFH
eukprot:UN03036